MRINLRTDAKYHNLALMKLSTYHKQLDDQIYLNGVGHFDLTYGSWLFFKSEKHPCDIEGGPAISPLVRLSLDKTVPDYELFSLNYSLGFTWSYCPRKCPFCVVPKQNNPKEHHSIWEFHDSKFKKICLLNNNTFSDPQWRETFEEIWDAELTVIEHGFDVRLIDDEKAWALRKTKFEKQIHYAWDLMENESQILRGLRIAPKGMVYVLVGFNTTQEEDLYRCQKIHTWGHDPYVMPYNGGTPELRNFKRFIDSRMYRHYENLKEAWKDWK